MADSSEAEKRFNEARQRVADGRAAMVDGARELQRMMSEVSDARARGVAHQDIWDARGVLGTRAGWFSQSGQDAFLNEYVFKGKREGVFVEVGGYDGVIGSNCLHFELFAGWSGLLVEASPKFCAMAEAVRRCKCVAAAVAIAEGEGDFLEVRQGLTQMGGMVEGYDPELRRQVEGDAAFEGGVISVPMRRLEGLLDDAGLREIDYVSLDVEGGELAVVEAFDFDRFDVTAWTIDNYPFRQELVALMEAKGYDRVEALGADDVYVKRGRV